VDPEQYAGQHVLVVGGGDSALEAAATLAEGSAVHVTLSYRGDAFSRAKPRNRERVDAAHRAGRLEVLLDSEVQSVTTSAVVVRHGSRTVELPNEALIVSVGGVLPEDFLRKVGIEVETKYGTA
jgi:thioredoxin reductase